jgi:hypothetical protein
MAVDEDKLMDVLHRFVGDLGATVAAGSVVVGDRLGLCRALAERPQRPSELAHRTGTSPRYVDEWLRGQAAGGYAPGAQAGQEPVHRLAADAGFARFRRVAETPFNIVYEARP